MVRPTFTIKDGPVGKYAKFVEHKHGLIRGWVCVKARKLKEQIGYDAKLKKAVVVPAPNDLWECFFEDPVNPRCRYGCLMSYPEEFTSKKSESEDPLGYNRAFIPPPSKRPEQQTTIWVGRTTASPTKPSLKPTLKPKLPAQHKPLAFRIRGQS